MFRYYSKADRLFKWNIILKATHFAVQRLEYESKQKSYSSAKPKFDNNSNHTKNKNEPWQLNKKLSTEEVDFGVGRPKHQHTQKNRYHWNVLIRIRKL